MLNRTQRYHVAHVCNYQKITYISSNEGREIQRIALNCETETCAFINAYLMGRETYATAKLKRARTGRQIAYIISLNIRRWQDDKRVGMR